MNKKWECLEANEEKVKEISEKYNINSHIILYVTPPYLCLLRYLHNKLMRPIQSNIAHQFTFFSW